MGEDTKDIYASQVAGICQELAAWRGYGISGVDGRSTCNLCLSPFSTASRIYTLRIFLRIAQTSEWTVPRSSSFTAIWGLEI